jgi:osmoprotectant transport system ATP-binding protein
LLGESGCGKTTLLKMINKLILPNSGFVKVKNKNISDWDTIKLRRSIGYVIQQIGLFPHMTVEKNIDYVLTLLKTEDSIKKKSALELIKLVGLDESYLNRYPRELSGGQRQRVGVARALAADPDIILMDEPFGAVDEINRNVLQNEMINIHKRLNKTIIFVTHDINEALKLGTRIILLNKGKIEQMGTKEELVFSPNSDFVRGFFGLKGFKSMLDDKKMLKIYDKVLNNNMDVNDAYDKIEEVNL